MAAVVCPIGSAEASAVTVSGESTYYSVGVTPAPRAGRFGAVVVVTFGNTPPTQFLATMTIQTADAAASSGSANSWRDLDSSAIQITDAGTFAIQCVDPIFDKVRLKIQASANGNDGASAQVYWLSDTTLTANV